MKDGHFELLNSPLLQGFPGPPGRDGPEGLPGLPGNNVRNWLVINYYIMMM